MSLYADYLKELWGKEAIEREYGFVTYLINGSECFTDTLYIRPEERRKGHCHKLLDEVTDIAKKRGCTHMTSMTSQAVEGWRGRATVILKYGFKIHKLDNEKIYFVKELK